jgi:hypothetical protein
MFTKLQNIYQLGCKELWSLWRDPIMLVLIIYTFTVSVYTSSTAVKETLQTSTSGLFSNYICNHKKFSCRLRKLLLCLGITQAE